MTPEFVLLMKKIDNLIARVEDLEQRIAGTVAAGGHSIHLNTPIELGGRVGTLGDFFGDGTIAKTSEKTAGLVLESGKASAKSRTGEVGKIYYVKGYDGDMHPVVDAFPE